MTQINSLLLESWLESARTETLSAGCPNDASLLGFAAREIPQTEATLFREHITGCAHCRKQVSRYLTEAYVPIIGSVDLAQLSQPEAVNCHWKNWFQSLVYTLSGVNSPELSRTPAGLSEQTPLHIDRAGRLLINLAFDSSLKPNHSAKLILKNRGTSLILGEVQPAQGALYAIVDFSAFEPRHGILKEDILQWEAVPFTNKLPHILPLLEQLRRESLQPLEYWDRLQPTVIAYGPDFHSTLQAEVAAVSESVSEEASKFAHWTLTRLQKAYLSPQPPALLATVAALASLQPQSTSKAQVSEEITFRPSKSASLANVETTEDTRKPLIRQTEQR